MLSSLSLKGFWVDGGLHVERHHRDGWRRRGILHDDLHVSRALAHGLQFAPRSRRRRREGRLHIDPAGAPDATRHQKMLLKSEWSTVPFVF